MPRERDYDEDDDTPIRSRPKGFPRYLLALAALALLAGGLVVAGAIAVVVVVMKSKTTKAEPEQVRVEKYTPGTTPPSPAKKGDEVFAGTISEFYLGADLEVVNDKDGKAISLKAVGAALLLRTKEGQKITCSFKVADERLHDLLSGDGITVSGVLIDYGYGVLRLIDCSLLGRVDKSWGALGFWAISTKS